MSQHAFKIAPLTLRFDNAGKAEAHAALLNGQKVFEMPAPSAQAEPQPMTPDSVSVEQRENTLDFKVRMIIRLT
jgi:hypothetical protein